MKIRRILALLMVLALCLSAAGCTNETLIESYYSDVPVEVEIEDTEAEGKDDTDTRSTASKDDGKKPVTSTATPVTEEGKKAQGIYPDLKGKKVVRLLWEKVSTADKAIYDRFSEITGAEVKTTVTTYRNYFTKLSAMVAAGTQLDSAFMHQEHFPLMITKDLLLPITKYVDKNDQLIDFTFMDQFKWNGEYYGLQLKGTNQNHMVVFFNEDMFKENGVKTPLEYYNEKNWTWTTFVDLCKKMTKNDKGNIEVYGCAVNDVSAFMNSTGNTFVEYDGTKLVNNVLNPDIIYSWKFIRDIAWSDNGYAYKTAGVLTDYLTNGKAAMAINGAFGVNRSTTADSNAQLYKMKDKWDWVPFPTYVDQSGTVRDYYAPTMFCQWNVPATAKNPEAGYWLNHFFLNPYKFEGSSFSESIIHTDADKKRLEELYSYKSKADFIGGVTGAQTSYDLTWDFQNKAAGDVDSVANTWKSKLDTAIKSCLAG